MRLDLRPVQNEHLLVMDHNIAEQLSKASKGFKYGVAKSPTYRMYYDLVGEHSVFSVGVSTNSEMLFHLSKRILIVDRERNGKR
jgi:hypothetical protein